MSVWPKSRFTKSPMSWDSPTAGRRAASCAFPWVRSTSTNSPWNFARSVKFVSFGPGKRLHRADSTLRRLRCEAAPAGPPRKIRYAERRLYTGPSPGGYGAEDVGNGATARCGERVPGFIRNHGGQALGLVLHPGQAFVFEKEVSKVSPHAHRFDHHEPPVIVRGVQGEGDATPARGFTATTTPSTGLRQSAAWSPRTMPNPGSPDPPWTRAPAI